MKEKSVFVLKTIELVTLIILYYIVGNKSIFLYVLSLSLYNIFTSCFTHISIKESLNKIKNTSNKQRLLKYVMLLILTIAIFFMLLGILISDIISITLNIDNILLIFIAMGLCIMIPSSIKILSEYYEDTNNNHKYQKINNIYIVLDNICLIIIAALVFRIFNVKDNIAICLMFLSKIISAILIFLLCYFLTKDTKIKSNSVIENINYKKELKYIFKNDAQMSIIDIVKNSYYYISIIVLYYVLNSRYGYAQDVIEKDITFIYLYSLFIINYLIYLAKLLNSELPKTISVRNRVYNNFKVMLTIAIVFGFISPLTCRVIFNNPDYSIYLIMTNFMAIFILLYEITYNNIKNKKLIYISLSVGLISKIILIIPLINSFYRMGYNLVYGDIISTIIGMFFSIIINYIYIKNVEKNKEKYFEKILNVLYENIILCIILILIEFVIPIDTNSYFKSLGLIIIYVTISITVIKLKNKKRG